MKQARSTGPRSIAEVASTSMPMLPVGAPEPVLQEAVPAAAAAPAPAPPSLSGLLGPTTISGFVDAYYGFNSNHPPTRQNGCRNFDVNTNQFGLNMIELVADRPVDTTNRLGYHVALAFGQAINLVNSANGETGFDQYLKE